MTGQRTVRPMGVIDGCINPESAELLADGETIVFGNCRLTAGPPFFRDGQGLVHLRGEASVSSARLSSEGKVKAEDRRLIPRAHRHPRLRRTARGHARVPRGHRLPRRGRWRRHGRPHLDRRLRPARADQRPADRCEEVLATVPDIEIDPEGRIEYVHLANKSIPSSVPVRFTPTRSA